MKMLDAEFQLINQRLADNFGSTADKPNFRLVWADDEKELRVTLYQESGLQLLYPEVRMMRKYPDIRERYVLERLIENFEPSVLEDGKPIAVLIHQAIWTFEILNRNRQRVGVVPSYDACKFVVATVLNAIEHTGYVKYKESGLTEEEQEQRIRDLQEELFGNESTITDALSLKQGVGYGPGSQPNKDRR